MLTTFDCEVECFWKEKIADFKAVGFQVKMKSKPVKTTEISTRLLMDFLEKSMLFKYVHI